MDELSKCHKFALKEVLGAVGLLKSRSGASARDIYFVLDNLHGKVQRPVINYALKAAVNKGLLNCVNNQYKLKRRRVTRSNTMRKTRSVVSRKSGRVRSRSALRMRSRSALRMRSRSPLRGRRSRRDSLSEADYSGSDHSVPVRNYECSTARKPKVRRSNSRKTYRFREVSSVESCNCDGCVDYSDTDVSSIFSDSSQCSSDPKPSKPRKKAATPKKKYPMPKKIKVEKETSIECAMNTDTKSTKSTRGGSKRKASGNKRSSSEKGKSPKVKKTGADTLQVSSAGSSTVEANKKYNLRSRDKQRDMSPQTKEASEQPPNAENNCTLP